jgi:hypothetical protein
MILNKSSFAQCRLFLDKKFTQLSITMLDHQVSKYICDLKNVLFNTGLNMQSVTPLMLFMQIQRAVSALNWTTFIIGLHLVGQNGVEEETKLANSGTR